MWYLLAYLAGVVTLPALLVLLAHVYGDGPFPDHQPTVADRQRTAYWRAGSLSNQ